MQTRYSIGQLARRAEVPTSTVRYYERAGLLTPAGRTTSNYRFYGEDAFERLRFIRAAQATGFTLKDITALLDLRDGTTAPCREVQVLIEARLADVAQQLGDLRHVQDVLDASLHICCQVCSQAEAKGRCQVIESLNVASATPTPLPARRKKKTKTN